MDKQRAEHEKELERRRKLAESCKPNKVRTYACNEFGYRTIQYYSYHYDFDEDTCVQKIKKVEQKCETIHENDYESDDDERDHKRSRKVNRRKSKSPPKGGKPTKADDFHQKKSKKMLTQKDLDKAAETDDIEDLQHKSNNMK